MYAKGGVRTTLDRAAGIETSAGIEPISSIRSEKSRTLPFAKIAKDGASENPNHNLAAPSLSRTNRNAPGFARSGLASNDDVHIPVEGGEKIHKAFDGKTIHVVICEG
jgi:hypothetical protein